MKNSPPGGQEISTAQPEDTRHWDILSITAITYREYYTPAEEPQAESPRPPG